jgi:hypothetical protein
MSDPKSCLTFSPAHGHSINHTLRRRFGLVDNVFIRTQTAGPFVPSRQICICDVAMVDIRDGGISLFPD